MYHFSFWEADGDSIVRYVHFLDGRVCSGLGIDFFQPGC